MSSEKTILGAITNISQALCPTCQAAGKVKYRKKILRCAACGSNLLIDRKTKQPWIPKIT